MSPISTINPVDLDRQEGRNRQLNRNTGGMLGDWKEFMYGPDWANKSPFGETSIPSWFSEQYAGNAGGAPGGPGAGGVPGAGGAPFNVTNVGLLTPEQQSLYSNFMAAAYPQMAGIASGRGGSQPNPAAFEDMWQTSIQAPAEKRFAETTIPGIKHSFTGPGYSSGARSSAEASARTDLDANLNAERARLVWANELANRESSQFDRQLSVASMSPFTQALGLPVFAPTLWEPNAIPTQEQIGSYPRYGR